MLLKYCSIIILNTNINTNITCKILFKYYFIIMLNININKNIYIKYCLNTTLLSH